jgi:hypothetical protein
MHISLYSMSYPECSNARLIFSYTKNVIIVPGKTRTIDTIKLTVS